MKRKTVIQRRDKIGNYAERKSEQLRGIFRMSSPFKLTEENTSIGIPFEIFKKMKKGQYRIAK